MTTRSIQTPRRQPQGLWIIGLILLGMIAFIIVRKADEFSHTETRNTLSLNMAGSTDLNPWNQVDRHAPLVRYPEIVNLDIEVRADEHYATYAIDRSVLFEPGQSAFRAGTAGHLEQIFRSVRQRFDGGRILVSGTADENDPANRTLALARAQAVRHWLVEQGLDEKSVEAEAGAASSIVGEKARLRQRIEILVRR